MPNLKPGHRRFLMSDLLGIANRAQAAAKSAKELRLKLEKAAESLFEKPEDAEENAKELRSLLSDSLASAVRVINLLREADMLPEEEAEPEDPGF